MWGVILPQRPRIFLFELVEDVADEYRVCVFADNVEGSLRAGGSQQGLEKGSCLKKRKTLHNHDKINCVEVLEAAKTAREICAWIGGSVELAA